MNWRRLTEVCVLTRAEQKAVVVVLLIVLAIALFKYERMHLQANNPQAEPTEVSTTR